MPFHLPDLGRLAYRGTLPGWNSLCERANVPNPRSIFVRTHRSRTSEKLIGDPVVFERTLRQTRNHFTHPGIRKRGNVLSDSKEIFFNRKVHVLLRLLMLKSIGFSEEGVFDQIFQQSRMWV